MFSNLGYRASRQFILLLIPFMVLGILLLFVYYQILPEPTCSDQVKNQNEEEIDCGGPCSSCLFKHIQNIQVSSVRFDEVGGGLYDVVAEVKNPNDKLLAKEFFYEFVLRDKNGVKMETNNGKSYLYAGETAHIIEGGIKVKKEIASVDFSIDNNKIVWIEGETKQPLILSGDKITEVVRKDDKAVTQLKLKIFNQALADFRDIEIGVLIMGDNKEINAINKTFVDFLRGGESAQLFFSWPGEFKINTANVLVEPRVNLSEE